LFTCWYHSSGGRWDRSSGSIIDRDCVISRSFVFRGNCCSSKEAGRHTLVTPQPNCARYHGPYLTRTLWHIAYSPPTSASQPVANPYFTQRTNRDYSRRRLDVQPQPEILAAPTYTFLVPPTITIPGTALEPAVVQSGATRTALTKTKAQLPQK
jgi:hypothetical protein